VGKKLQEAFHVANVLIQAEPDPQYIATNVRDAISCLEVGMPTLRVGAAEGQEAGMRAGFQRVEQFGSR